MKVKYVSQIYDVETEREGLGVSSAYYLSWFPLRTGLLRLMVPYLEWLAILGGSLYGVACSSSWFSRRDGLLQTMVLSSAWLA